MLSDDAPNHCKARNTPTALYAAGVKTSRRSLETARRNVI